LAGRSLRETLFNSRCTGAPPLTAASRKTSTELQAGARPQVVAGAESPGPAKSPGEKNLGTRQVWKHSRGSQLSRGSQGTPREPARPL